MPNHVHGILVLEGRRAQDYRKRDATARGCDAGSLGAIVGAFKAASARRINDLRGTRGAPVWQRGYYERVIRDERELSAARQYILDNPRKWIEDKHNPCNVRREIAALECEALSEAICRGDKRRSTGS